MASYRLEWRKSTKKDLRKLPPIEVTKIVRVVSSLADDPFPSGCEKLSGSEHAFRIRVGDYRVIYEVFDALVLVEVQRVAHRKDVYRP